MHERHTHHHEKPRVLFILKLRHTSGGENCILKSSGLYNSAEFCKDMLVANGYEAALVQVVDNNGIDHEVHEYRPDVVIIEALWVVPTKFIELKRLHPNVKWIIRVHSKIPFLAGEGNAIEWINKCSRMKNVFVSLNSEEAHKDFLNYFNERDPMGYLAKKLVYLPNYYPVKDVSKRPEGVTMLDVGCFGAIRLMKNPVTQAFAAIRYAESIGKRLQFHVNSGRIEHGMSTLTNMRALFAPFRGKHTLVEHEWMEREIFLSMVRAMDIGLQMSLSESFNIVAADFVSEDVPMVTSREIDWMPEYFTTDATSVEKIVEAMDRTLKYRPFLGIGHNAKKSLRKYVEESERIWLKTFKFFEHNRQPCFCSEASEKDL